MNNIGKQKDSQEIPMGRPKKTEQTFDITGKKSEHWRQESSHLNNKRLEQHPNGMWRYPGNPVAQFVPLPPHLIPADYTPNFKRIHQYSSGV